MTDTRPLLSVIIAATGPGREAPAALTAALAQAQEREVEVLFAYSSDHELENATVQEESGVISVRLPKGASLPRLLGAAMGHARGQIIAITDATCGLDGQWVAAILKAHDLPHPVIGGAVEPDGLRRLVDWAAYFCDYAQFMTPLPRGVAREMPGNNISMKRWILSKGREHVEKEFWKTYWCRHLQADGLQLHSDSSIVVYYRKSFGFWQYLVHRFHNGRCFAGMRLSQLSPLRRLGHWAGSPLLPALFCARILRVILPKRRHLGRFALAFPLVVLAMISWAAGEWIGYVLGPGTSCRHVG